MNRMLDLAGTLLGLLGVFVMVVAVAVRLGGNYFLFGTEVRAWLIGGIALVVVGCFAKLHVLTRERLGQ